MEKLLVTTTIYLQLLFSLSLCNPLFRLTEAGNVETKTRVPEFLIRGITLAHCANLVVSLNP